MTTPPYPYEPQYFPPQPNPRPTSVTVLSVIGIIIAALSLLCMGCSLPFIFIKMPFPNPAADALRTDPALMAWTVVGMLWTLGLAAMLLVCSIASLTLKPWARRGMVTFAILALVWIVLSLVVGLAWGNARMEAALAAVPPPPNMPQGQQIQMFKMDPALSTALNLLLSLPYPICVWYFFTRPRVVQAFDSGAAGAV